MPGRGYLATRVSRRALVEAGGLENRDELRDNLGHEPVRGGSASHWRRGWTGRRRAPAGIGEGDERDAQLFFGEIK